MTTTREVNNTGAPLTAPDGTVYEGAYVRFQLVDSRGNPVDAWDATNEERVMGSVTATTDANGEFTVDLWPNDRGSTVTYYDCSVNRSGIESFRSQVATGAAALSWWDFKSYGTAITAAESETIQSYIDSRLGLTPYDNVIYVSPDDNGDYTTITAAAAAITDAATDNRYLIRVLPGAYTEDVTIPAYVSLKGETWNTSRISGSITMAGYGNIFDLLVSCTTAGTSAITTNSYTMIVNVGIQSYVSWDGDQVCVEHAGTDGNDCRLMNCFVYAYNTNAGSNARAICYKHSGTAGDIEAHNCHSKESAGVGKAVLAWNASTGAASDIIVTGSWSVFNDTLPVVGDNDNTDGGQIKAYVQYENDASDRAAVTSSGDVVHDVGVQPHIADADGNLADITTKFNTLLSQLETKGILATS